MLPSNIADRCGSLVDGGLLHLQSGGPLGVSAVYFPYRDFRGQTARECHVAPFYQATQRRAVG